MERKHGLTICRELSEEIIHPKAYDAFRRLAYDLKRSHEFGELGCLFLPFETYRSPWRQAELYHSQQKVTNARQYESAHQFGLAVDFVPNDNGRWSWHDSKPWDELKRRAERVGLTVPMAWDRAHVEHPLWPDYRACLRVI